MTGGTSTRSRRLGWIIAACTIVSFFALQIATLDYGTRINDIPFIRDYRITSDVFSGSGLNRDRVIANETRQPESLDLRMVRFKLYPVEADEVLNIIALARIQPGRMQFDPRLYQYGGAFLYPLGAWYMTLSKIGLVHVAPLNQLLAAPQQMDGIWIAGRLFVLLAFSASALVLYLTLIELASIPVAIAGLAIYLFCPASIMFSQVIKPHWYALLWVNAALFILARAFIQNRMTFSSELLLAVFIGLAVGSAPTFSLLAGLLWGATATLVMLGKVPTAALLRIPTVAVLVFLLSNPFYILNWPAVRAEQVAVADWYRPSAGVDALVTFVQNSLFAGFGLTLTLLIFAAVALNLIRGPLWARLLALSIVTPITITAILTANLAGWNVNFRYIPYLLPAAIVFLALTHWHYREALFALVAVTTIAQAAPMKLAYFDENSDAHSTRLLAAAWMNSNIPKEDSICASTDTLTPYDVPPFRFDQHKINSSDCLWQVSVDRHPSAIVTPVGFKVEKKFLPRFTLPGFPLVWEHINPQISIYRKDS